MNEIHDNIARNTDWHNLLPDVVGESHALRDSLESIAITDTHAPGVRQRNWPSITSRSSPSGRSKYTHIRWRQYAPLSCMKKPGKSLPRSNISSNVRYEQALLKALRSCNIVFLNYCKKAARKPSHARPTNLLFSTLNKFIRTTSEQSTNQIPRSGIQAFLPRVMQSFHLGCIDLVLHPALIIKYTHYCFLSHHRAMVVLVRRAMNWRIHGVYPLGSVPIHFKYLQRRHASA